MRAHRRLVTYVERRDEEGAEALWRKHLEEANDFDLATQDERILVTRNSRDFAPITRRWSEAGRQHAGVIIIWSLTHRQFNEIVHGVEHWLGQYPNPQDWRGLVVGI